MTHKTTPNQLPIPMHDETPCTMYSRQPPRITCFLHSHQICFLTRRFGYRTRGPSRKRNIFASVSTAEHSCLGISFLQHALVDARRLTAAGMGQDVHLLALAVGRVWVAWVALTVILGLVHLVHSAGVVSRHLIAAWRVSNRGQLRTAWPRWIIRPASLVGVSRRFTASVGRTLPIFLSLSLLLLLLFPLFPLFSDLFELCMNTLVGANFVLTAKRNQEILSVGSVRLYAT